MTPATKSMLSVLCAAFALMLSGCGTTCPECPIPVAQPDLAADCADWQWIGVLEALEETAGYAESDYAKKGLRPRRRCPLPEAEGWSARHLFCPDAATAAGAGAPLFPLPPDCGPADLPPALEPFCLYRHEDAGGDLAAAKIPGLIALARDCAAVGPMADAEQVRSSLAERRNHFLAQTGRLDAPAAAAAAESTRLALVDTSPTAPAFGAAEPRSLHGRSLAEMAEQLAGGPGLGAALLNERLALAYVRFDRRSRRLSVRDEARGGFFGTFGDLAQAVRGEVRAWRASGEDHLVLNLALGWQHGLGGLEANVGDMPAPVQAIYRALEDAQCRGALTVAAAGNRTWGPDLDANRGPLLPGGWERRPAPDAAACTTALGGTPALVDDRPGDPSDDYRPLLYAVGGIEADGRPLGNSRAAFGGEPRLVAFADHAVVPRRRDAGRPGAVLTGSSVATAAAALAAAELWSRDGGRDGFQVMQTVYDRSSTNLGSTDDRTAGFCLAPGDEDCRLGVHRLSVARAVGGTAAAAASAAQPAPSELRLDSAADRVLEGVPTVDGAVLQALPANRRSACPPRPIAEALQANGEEAVEQFRNGGEPQAALFRCPRWQLADVSARPAAAPQPESTPCTGCGFEHGSPGTLFVEIDPSFGGRLSSPVLYDGTDAYALPVDPDETPVFKIVNFDSADGNRLFLSFVVDGTRSATAPLLRVRKP